MLNRQQEYFHPRSPENILKLGCDGVPIMAQWLTNPTRNDEVVGSIPELAQWVKNPAMKKKKKMEFPSRRSG